MKPDNFYAKISFFLSLGFWIPLFNLGMTMISMYYGIKALKLINKDRKKYGGLKMALAGIIISLTAIIMTVTGMVIFGIKKITGISIL